MSHYCVQCGTVLEPRVIEGRELEACPNDDFVLWHDPKVSTAVVIEVDGGVLLGRRAIEPGLGLWCLPGGFINDDESPWDAAARECREEICAEVEQTRLLGVFHIRKQDAPSMIGIAYQARLAAGARPSAGVEMLEGRGIPGRLSAAARISQPPQGVGRLRGRYVPGAAGGSGTSDRLRKGSEWRAAITSAIEATAQAVNPAA